MTRKNLSLCGKENIAQKKKTSQKSALEDSLLFFLLWRIKDVPNPFLI